MKYSSFRMSPTPDGQIPFVHHWRGGSSPKAVMIVAHGMGEHGFRYVPLARELVEAGFCVYANDHRGHGKTVRDESQLGDYGPDGWRGLIDDQLALIARVRADQPGLPVFLLGHSMGSFVAQHVLTEASELLAAAALSGTTAVDVVAAGTTSSGGDSFAGLNNAFLPCRTAFDWLSRDTAQVDLYLEDPLCGFTVTEAALLSLADAGIAFSAPQGLAGIRADLPIYVFAGDADPVGGNGELVKLVASRYREAGVRDVQVKIYPEARHEMLNEINRDEVTADLLRWVKRVLG